MMGHTARNNTVKKSDPGMWAPLRRSKAVHTLGEFRFTSEMRRINAAASPKIIGAQTFAKRPYADALTPTVNEFYKKGCQEKSSPSTGGREDFVSRSSPLHCKSASRFAREVLLLSCLPFLFYKKGCQEKSSPSTGGREDFVSRSSPLHCKSASRFAREVLLL